MSLIRRLPILIAASLLTGCAARPKLVPIEPASPTRTASTQAVDPKVNLALSDIEPVVTLPALSTRPAGVAPLEAIQLYAKARAALLANQRFTAINHLEKAVALDPTSAELRQALARALLGTANFNDPSIAALEKAATIEPDDLDVQLDLGRQYLSKGDVPKATVALRKAMLTDEYKKGEDQAALTDFFLASALQRGGYDRAALDCYRTLLTRIQSPGPNLRGNAELNYLITRPDAIWIEMAGLYEKGGRYEEALASYESAAERDDESFDLQARIVRVLTQLKRPLAKERAAETVKAFDGRPDAVALLRETHRNFGNEAGAVDVLRQLYKDEPTNRLMLYALSDTLQQLGRPLEARQLLAETAKSSKYEVVLVERLLRLYEADRDWRSGARLLIEASHQRPDLVSRLSGLWARLVRPMARQRVRLSDIAALQVPPDQEGVKHFWVATLAAATNRNGLAKSSMQRALDAQPPFVPAFRMAIGEALAQDDAIDSVPVKSLLDRTSSQPALAAELQGIVLLQQKKPAEAETTLRRAGELGGKSADLQDELYQALLAQNKDTDAENALWALIRDWPDYEPAYLQLANFYAARGRHNQTIKTLETWLANDPSSATARLLQARFLFQSGRADVGESLLNQLLLDEMENGEVLLSIRSIYEQQRKVDQFSNKLTDLYTRHPQNRWLLEQLVDVQRSLGRMNEATRLLDAARVTFASDADGLYVLSGMYQNLDQKQTTEDLLLAVLKVDPAHAGASNDLGYNWVDSGRNLERAESLVRVAVAAEPDNQAFLDSLGWVLYKRSQFAEAVTYLQQASEGLRPDPIVLDHLGDALYRAGRSEDAQRTWELASQRLEKLQSDRSDLKQLKLQLNQKLRQVKAGIQATVAPVIEHAPAGESAKGNASTIRKSEENSNGRP